MEVMGAVLDGREAGLCCSLLGNTFLFGTDVPSISYLEGCVASELGLMELAQLMGYAC